MADLATRPGPVAVPTLDEILADPALAATLPPAAAADLLGPCEAELARRQRVRDLLLIRAAVGGNGIQATPDLFDDIDEAARLIGRTAHFIYRNHRSLPFVVQEGRGRRLRFSRSEIDRFLEAARRS